MRPRYPGVEDLFRRATLLREEEEEEAESLGADATRIMAPLNPALAYRYDIAY